jgi:hypothetical protein
MTFSFLTMMAVDESGLRGRASPLAVRVAVIVMLLVDRFGRFLEAIGRGGCGSGLGSRAAELLEQLRGQLVAEFPETGPYE